MEIPTFIHPFTCIISGSTGSGKTFFIRKLLQYHSQLISNLAKDIKITYCYGIYSRDYEIPIPGVSVNYHDGLISEEDIKVQKPDIIIVDDLMSKSNDQNLCDLFTRGSHHCNFSIIYVTQNIFSKGKYMREINLNSHYAVFMKSPRALAQIQSFGQQLYLKRSAFLVEAYNDATKNSFGYLIVDSHPRSENKLRVRTDIFPVAGIISPKVYIPK